MRYNSPKYPKMHKFDVGAACCIRDTQIFYFLQLKLECYGKKLVCQIDGGITLEFAALLAPVEQQGYTC